MTSYIIVPRRGEFCFDPGTFELSRINAAQGSGMAVEKVS